MKSGSPSDPCTVRLLASVAETVNPEVNTLIRLSFQEAPVPVAWKQAKILPLLKKNPRLTLRIQGVIALFPFFLLSLKSARKQLINSLLNLLKGQGYSILLNQGFELHIALSPSWSKYQKLSGAVWMMVEVLP